MRDLMTTSVHLLTGEGGGTAPRRPGGLPEGALEQVPFLPGVAIGWAEGHAIHPCLTALCPHAAQDNHDAPNRDPGVFLERHGEHLGKQDLGAFEGLRGDYEVRVATERPSGFTNLKCGDC